MFFARLGIVIIIYSFQRFGRGDKPMYDGTKFVLDTNNIIKHSLRIMYYETLKHYQPILNLVAAAGSRGYCIPCNKIFSREESHKCSQKCSKCFQKPSWDTGHVK